MPHWTALVTLLAVMLYLSTGIMVARARRNHRLPPPATTGNPDFERVFRVQMNTLEWMPIFLPALWLFAIYVGDVWAAVVGCLWIAGRVLYMNGYYAATEKRGPGFGVQAIACLILLAGGLFGAISRLIHG